MAPQAVWKRLARQAGRPDVEAIHLGDLANLARRDGDPARALALQHSALEVEVRLGDQRQIAICLEHLAAIQASTGCGEQAARLLGVAQVLRETICSPQPVPEQVDTEQAVAQARAVLGDDFWAAAIEAGRTLPVEAAIAEALATP